MPKRTKKYSRGQTWGAMKKAWTGFNAAMAEGDKQRVEIQKKHIQQLRKELGLKQRPFRDSLKVTYVTKPKRRTSPRRGRRTSPRAARRVRRTSPRAARRRTPGRRVFRRAGRRSPSPQLRR